MGKNLKELEKDRKELLAKQELAKSKKVGEVQEAQIQVYEGQSYEARNEYAEAQKRKTKTRAKLPKDIPTDTEYREQDLQAQYIKQRITTPQQSQQVDEYRDEIKKQREAKKELEVINKEMSKFHTLAVKEVDTVKSNVQSAKESAQNEYDAEIQTYTTKYDNVVSEIKTEKDRRADEIKSINLKYDSIKNPYPNLKSSKGHGVDNSSHTNWNNQQYASRKKELVAVRTKNLAHDGWTPTPTPVVNWTYSDASAVLSGKASYASLGGVSKYQVDVARANRSVMEGTLSVSGHTQAISAAKAKYQGFKDWQSAQFSKTAQTNAYSQRQKVSQSFANVAANPATSNPNYKPTNRSGSGTSSDPFRYNTNAEGTGIESKEVDKNKLAYYLQTLTVTNTGLENTQFHTDGKRRTGTDVTAQSLLQINKQRETELANKQQQQIEYETRSGNLSFTDALLNPKTTQSYTGKDTRNLKTFLEERGYDTTNPDTIPNSVLMTPVKYDKARKVATEAGNLNTPMGDLRFKEPYYAGLTKKDGFIYKYPEATAVVQQKRKEAKERIAQFDPIQPNIQKVEPSKALKFTDLKSPQVGTLDSGGTFTKKEFNPYSASNPIEMAQGYQYTVPSAKTTTFPTMSGSTFKANTPTSFDTIKEAEDYVKNNQPKVFSGTDDKNWNDYNYRSAVLTGEVPHPNTTPSWNDDAKFYGNAILDPVKAVSYGVANLVLPEDEKIPVYESASGQLIGGTITDIMDGTPLKGSGVKNTWEYIQADPIGTALELPAEIVMAVTGGKAVSLGVKGVSAGVKASTKLGIKIIQSEAPNIIKVPTMAMLGAGQTVGRVGAKISVIPNKIGSHVYDYGTIPNSDRWARSGAVWSQQFTMPQQIVRHGLVKPYDTATMFQGSRVGFGAKANFIMTPSGRMFVRQSTEIASDMGVKPQFLNRQVAMFETEGVTGFATRGKMKTTTYKMPKETPFKSDVFAPTGKTKVIPKEGYPKVDKPFPELYDSKATTSGKPFPELVKVEDIPVSKIETPNPFDRLKHSVLKDTETMPTIKKVKTNIDEVTFYSDTTGDLIKGVKRPKAELQGGGVNYRGFEKPEITSTRTRLQDYKTSTSESTIKGQLKYSKVAGGKIKFKGSPIRQVDTIVTGAKLTGKKNLKLIDDMVEEGQIEEIGKKTVMKGEDYFGGGKKHNLKEQLEDRNITKFESATDGVSGGSLNPIDETIIYGVSKGKIPVDKKAFAQTMKESNLLREMSSNPLNKKPVVPKGVDEPAEQYHAFIGESKSVGGNFRGTRISLGSVKGEVGMVTSTGIVKPTYPAFPVNKFTGTKVNVGSGDATSTKINQLKVIPALPINKFTSTKVNLGSGAGTDKINNVKGFSTKTDVVGITTNRANVKHWDDTKIQKGDKIVDSKGGSTVQKTKLEPPKVIQTPVQIQISKVKAGVKVPKVSPKIKQIVTPVISQKTETALTQKTVQSTKQKTGQKLKTKQSQRLRAVQSQVAVTAVVSRTAQVQATATMTPPVLQRTVARRPVIIAKIDLPVPERKPKKTKRGKKAGFIGNVRLDNIMGMYKRKEITYGQKKVTKLERQDMRLTAGTPNRIAMPSSSLLKTKKKKKSKTESIFGRNSKDEFAGFTSKPKKKSKGKKKSKAKRLM